jgi:sugar lactone lactonase YvrE
VRRIPFSFANLSFVCLVMVSALLLLVFGCGGSSTGSVPVSMGGTTSGAGVSFGGKVMAGSQPVSGATVQLYAAGGSGYGSAGTALLTTVVTTSSSGSFTVPAGYACASSSTQVYLVARGGVAGSGTGSNSSLAMMAALGSCGAISSSTAVVMNEVTTVASVAALAAFYSTGGNVGASATNAAGLANAFGTAGQLANMTTGTSPGASLPAGLSIPSAKINTLASILNSCTASIGESGCAALMTAAVPTGAEPSANTLDAVFEILRDPANNVSVLNALLPASPAFTPVTTSAVPEWTLAVTWSGGGMNLPTAMAFDSSGNAWVASYFNALTELPALGTSGTVQQIAPASSVLNESYGLTVDGSNNIWVANEQTSNSINSGNGNVVKFSNTGQVLSGANGFSAGGVYFPQGMAADTTGNVWVVDYGDSRVSLLSSSGSAVNGAAAWGSGQLFLPVAIAVDANHNAWVANQSASTITRVAADGSSAMQVSCCAGASGLAVDQGGNVWVANYLGGSISEVSSTGAVVLNGQTGGGVDHPQAVAVDGTGRVWVGNFHKGTLSEFAGNMLPSPGTPLSPPAGLGTDAQLGSPFALAIDQSGNLWVTNSNGANTVTVFVGLATPVKTPLLGPPQLP